MRRSISRKRPSSSELSRWFHRACRGEDGALQKLFALYRPLLLKLARDRLKGALRPKVAPSDVVQSTVWKATQDFAPQKFPDRDHFRAWLVTILKNEAGMARRRFRKTKRRDLSRERPLHGTRSRDWLARLSESLSLTDAVKEYREETIAQVRQAMTQLPMHYEYVLRLRHFEELPFQLIAQKLEREYDAVRMLHNRALLRLKKEIDAIRNDVDD